ncbi:hypothetical protein QN244_07995 [Xanthomonas rydalmerensis]|uniref:Uncharacterized protein n=1 Tax=Xanthomonas rydalmerensis TaxID=3046274 RepID=A0ABZ0JTD0_9XANT|nr:MULTISPECIES: hypothetical protein [unclassified Xanthomonas]KMM76410.1 hypothetical protein ACP93_06280 [Xanthomonas sp. NCPPB 1128]MBB5943145.1 hypothetical protein [Xanthomonas sp. 3307]WOS42367.1 hypothetical protein QN243_07995 [Xanthomonas sp. DM-2023]WOS46553.1 hypothetical protein QN242_07995 [Xanthomonas sp. DM-2023]WOS50733.1 hypothetical protein QN240_07995 [Xanthomonas sp. DM-2023]
MVEYHHTVQVKGRYQLVALTREPEYSPANVVGYAVTTDGGARVDPHDMSWDEARVFLDTLVERDRDAVSAEKKPSRNKPSTRQRR